MSLIIGMVLSLRCHYTPYDIEIDLKPNETKRFYIKCTVEELDDKNGFEIVRNMNRAIQLMMQSGYSNSFALNLVSSRSL